MIKQILMIIHASDMASIEGKQDPAALALGEKIRAQRQRLNRTLDQTATGAGISKPFLSQVVSR